MKSRWLFVLAMALIVGVSLQSCGRGADRHVDDELRLGLFLYADHTAINASRDGFLEYVKSEPAVFGENPEIVVRNVGGDPTKLAAYADYFSTEPFDLVVALGTPCAKVLAERNQMNKAVFGAPPDARLAGVVADPERPGGMTTGVTYRPPVDRILEVLVSLLPEASTVGVLHNPAEPNSQLVVDEFVAKAKAKGLDVVDRPVNESAEIALALEAILGSVDVVFAPNDNTVHSAFPAVLSRTSPRRVPVISVDRGSVEKGALVGVGGDYFEIGRVMGEVGVRLLGGAEPATTPVVEAARATRVYINEGVARSLGVDVPEDLATQAELVP